MTKGEWAKVNEYITKLQLREVNMVEHINNQNYGLARMVFFEEIEPLVINVED